MVNLHLTERFENGTTPAVTTTLEWETFSEAADEAGLSRIYGGIHFDDGDLNGRSLGRAVGREVWAQAQKFAQAADLLHWKFRADGFSDRAEIGVFVVDDATGTVDQRLDDQTGNEPAIYFPFLGANADGADHIRLFGNNTFGFEEMALGGDQDFDDMIMQVSFA
ncbi:MAG: DUF4114 domain-containing protein [Cyanobacteria bacterium J06626_6]